jgi:hypothetical protein
VLISTTPDHDDFQFMPVDFSLRARCMMPSEWPHLQRPLGPGPGGYEDGHAQSDRREAAMFNHVDRKHGNDSARVGKSRRVGPDKGRLIIETFLATGVSGQKRGQIARSWPERFAFWHKLNTSPISENFQRSGTVRPAIDLSSLNEHLPTRYLP